MQLPLTLGDPSCFVQGIVRSSQWARIMVDVGQSVFNLWPLCWHVMPRRPQTAVPHRPLSQCSKHLRQEVSVRVCWFIVGLGWVRWQYPCTLLHDYACPLYLCVPDTTGHSYPEDTVWAQLRVLNQCACPLARGCLASAAAQQLLTELSWSRMWKALSSRCVVL